MPGEDTHRYAWGFDPHRQCHREAPTLWTVSPSLKGYLLSAHEAGLCTEPPAAADQALQPLGWGEIRPLSVVIKVCCPSKAAGSLLKVL